MWRIILDTLKPEKCYINPQTSPTFHTGPRIGFVIKAKMLSGTYPVQARLKQFNQHAVDPTCTFCKQSIETLEHFISSCERFYHDRTHFIEVVLENIDHTLAVSVRNLSSSDFSAAILFGYKLRFSSPTMEDAFFSSTLLFLTRLHVTRCSADT